MGLDIKLPIGLMFTILGVLVTIFGLFTSGDDALYSRSLGININLWSGVGMLVFGLVMLWFSRKKDKSEKKTK